MQFEEFMLEGYGPGGTALLLEISTDKRNRVVAEVRNILTKHNGTMAEPGAVAWQFKKKGLVVIEGQPVTEEQLFDLVLEAGAEDVKQTPSGFEIISEPADFEAVKAAIEKAQIETSLSATCLKRFMASGHGGGMGQCSLSSTADTTFNYQNRFFLSNLPADFHKF